MQYVNYILLVGNLGSDPEIRVLESGIKMAKFCLATTECYFDKQGIKQTHTQWHSIVCWRHEADYAQRYLFSGSLARIEGRIRNRTFTHPKDKTKESPYDIIATSIQLMTNDTIKSTNELYYNNTPNPQKNQPEEEVIFQAAIDPDNLPF